MAFSQLAEQIATLQQQTIPLWKKQGIHLQQTSFLRLVEENHAFNYQLWHAEDKARRDDKGFEYVYKAKRAIDKYNQERNNRMEAMDNWLFDALKPAPVSSCPVHTETLGMIIDRLSILSLKQYHMNEQVIRPEASEEHQQQCARKLAILNNQKNQLTKSLAELIDDITHHRRTFVTYHQFKMYNDPQLNPELYHPS